MKKEISKGTQKFILLMTAVIVVFVLALTAIIKFAPDPVRTTSYDEPQQTASSQQSEGTDFDSVKGTTRSEKKSTVSTVAKVRASCSGKRSHGCFSAT